MHPSRDDLQAFVLGKLEEQQAVSINSHIDQCPTCEDTVRQLETSADELVHWLKARPVADSFEGEPGCRELVARAESTPLNPTAPSERLPAGPPAHDAVPADLGSLGHYQFLEKLGEGGMGAVYKARHTRLKRLVAVKVLPRERMNNAGAVLRFQREMEAVGRLHHPNIVGAHDAGDVEGTHFLVMEYVEGVTLSAIIQQRGTIGVADACELVRQAACGLDHAHQHGLVHRDIKPSNLILAQDGVVKVLDLGLARLWGDDAVEDGLTSTGQIMGTADYIAPDQAADPHGADIRADIYSLGCTLYHLLAGRPPFRGPGYNTVMQKVLAHSNTPVPSLHDSRTDLPAGLVQVISRMLAKSPADRYATPAELIAALGPFCSGASLGNLLSPSSGQATQPAPASTHSTAHSASDALCETHITISAQVAPLPSSPAVQSTSPPRRTLNRRLAAMAGSTAALALLLGVIILQTGSGELELEVNEPDVRVTIDGTQEITLKSPRDHITITVPAGKHTLHVVKDGFETDVREFRIIRNGKVELSAKLRPMPPKLVTLAAQTASSEPAPDRERQIAEWVLDRGGQVSVWTHSGGRHIAVRSELPIGPLVIETIDMQHAIKSASDDWPPISHLKGIRTLYVCKSWADDDALEQIGQLSTLRTLAAYDSTAITDRGARHLRELKRLLDLDLSWTGISDSGVDALSQLSRLEVLQLNAGSKPGRLSDRLLTPLSKLSRLRTLRIGGGTITDAGLRTFPQLQRLSRLDLIGQAPSLSGEALRQFPILPELRSFGIQMSDVSAGSLEQFAGQSGLTQIWLVDSKISPDDVSRLQAATPDCLILHPQGAIDRRQQSALEWLRALHATGNAETASGQGMIIESPSSEPFGIREAKVNEAPNTAAEWELFRTLRTLRLLHLSGEWLTDTHLQAVWDALGSDERLEHLLLSSNQFTDAALAGIAEQKQLRSLILGNRNLTESALRESLPRLSRLQLLNFLAPVTDSIWSIVAELPELQTLYLGSCVGIHGEGLEALRAMKELQELNLMSTSIDNEHIGKLAQLPELTVLYLSATPLTDTGLANLSSCQALRVLYAKDTKITAAGVGKLQQALPKCTIFWDGNRPGTESVATFQEPKSTDDTAIDFVAERKAAEWVVARGGVIVADAAGKYLGKFQPSNAKLPNQPFFITHVTIQNAQLVDADLAHLAGCCHLQHVNLDGNRQITGAGLKFLRRNKDLQSLGAVFATIGPEFGELLTFFPALQQLHLQWSTIDDSATTNLPDCPRLRTLDIGNTKITDAGLEEIVRHCPKLTEVIFSTGPCSILPLKGLHHLRSVGCSGGNSNQVSETGVAVLQALPDLAQIGLGSPTTDDDLQKLSALGDKITHFHIMGWAEWDPGVSEAGYAHILKFRNLRELSLRGNRGNVTDDVLARLTGLPELQKLTLIHEASARLYTSEGLNRFRELRPDVHLHADGVDYAPSSTIPFATLQKLDETDPLPAWKLPEGAPPPVVAPCKPDEAAARQREWAEFLKRPVVEEGPLGMKFALIPPGEFRKIFTRPNDPTLEPDMAVRRFRITKPYAIGTTEVTWDQFRQFVEATGYKTDAETSGAGGRLRDGQLNPQITWRNPGWKPDPNEPVAQVTPHDAEAFCDWLNGRFLVPGRHKLTDPGEPEKDASEKSKSSNTSGRAEKAPRFRLPTEAEWVHACRAGSIYTHVVGPTPQDLAEYAWSSEFLEPHIRLVHIVGLKKPNPFGLHDMLGNVAEFTADAITAAALPYLATNNPIAGRVESSIGFGHNYPAVQFHPEMSHLGFGQPWYSQGIRVLMQIDDETFPGPLDPPLVLQTGQAMSVHALVPRPEQIAGLRSWSVELASSHTTYTQAIAVSPQHDLIATGSFFGKISLWDREGNFRRALLGSEGAVVSLDISHDGRWLASCDNALGERGNAGNTARVWNLETGTLHAIIPIQGAPTRIKFSPDGNQLAVSRQLQYRPAFLVIDLVSGRGRTPNTNEEIGRGLAWSPDGTTLASSTSDNHLRLWDVRDLRPLRDVDAPASAVLEWSPDGRWLAMRTAEGTTAIRDAQTLAVVRTIAVDPYWTHTLAWFPDSRRFVVGQGDSRILAIYDSLEGTELIRLEPGGPGHAIALTAGGAEAVIEEAGRLVFFDTATGRKLREGKVQSHVSWAKLSIDGNDVYAQPPSGQRNLFSAITGERRRTWSDPANAHSIPFPSPDGSLVAYLFQSGLSIQIADAQTGITRHELSYKADYATRAEWSPNGTRLATSGTDNLVRIWNAANGTLEQKLEGHKGIVWSIAWSASGTRLATVADDKTVRVWESRMVGPPENNGTPVQARDDAGLRSRFELTHTFDKVPESLQVDNNSLQTLVWIDDTLWIAVGGYAVPLDVRTGNFGELENFSNGNTVTFLNPSPNGQQLLGRETYHWTFVRNMENGTRKLLGQFLGKSAQWHPDNRRILGCEPEYATVAFDVQNNRRLGLMIPWLTGDHWITIGPTGHFRGSAGVEEHIVYVAMHEDGSQHTYTPAVFAEKFGWKNDPEQTFLLGPDTGAP